MTTICKEWGVPEGFFQGLCSKAYEPLQGTSECPVCVSPKNAAADCNTCPDTPPYVINLTISGAMAAHSSGFPNTSNFPTAYDNNTWRLFNTSPCVWESEETELMAYFYDGNTYELTLSNSQPLCCTRKRFKLSVTGIEAQTNKVLWSLEIRYTIAGTVVRSATLYHTAKSSICSTSITKWGKTNYIVDPGRFYPTQLFISPYVVDTLFMNIGPFINTSV